MFGVAMALEKDVRDGLDVMESKWLTEVAASAASNRIQTWALEEARRRLEAEGILPPDPSSVVPGKKP